MNLLTFCQPTHIYRSDACEHGLGGYAKSEHAWRWSIPDKLQGRAHINIMEFLACIVYIWIDSHNNRIQTESYLLSMGDSTTAQGRMWRSNFQPSDKSDTDTTTKLTAARTLTRLILRNNSCLYS